MHKSYKDNDNLTAAISKEVEKSLKQYGKKNKDYLAKQVERNVKELTKGVDIEKNVNSLVSDTVAEIDSLHGLSLNSDLNEFNKQYEEMKYNTKAVYQKVPGRSKSAFNKMYDKANNMILDGDATIDQAVRSVTKNYKPTIQYKNGANVPMDSYLRMLYRTNQSNVAELRTNQIADALGTDVYEYSSHSEPREDCGDIQGKLVAFGKHSMVQVGENKKQRVLNIYDYGYGEAGGARGINCTHFMFAFTGFFRGKTKDVIGNMANAKEDYKPPKQKKKGELKINNAVTLTIEDIGRVFNTSKANQKMIMNWMNNENYDDGVRMMIKNYDFKTKLKITKKNSKGAYFSPYEHAINMPQGEGSTTFIHEFGHAFEFVNSTNRKAIKFKENNNFEFHEKNILELKDRKSKRLDDVYAPMVKEINDKRTEANRAMGDDAWKRAGLREEADELLEKYNNAKAEDIEFAKISAIQDSVDGITKGYVYDNGLGIGHGSRYYSYEGFDYAEIYTHGVTLMGLKDKEYLDMFHDSLGEKAFNELIGRIKEDNPYWKEGFDYER